MSKRIRIPKTDFFPVQIGRDLEAVIHGVRMIREDELHFDLGLKDKRQERRIFVLTFPAYLTPTSSLTEFLTNTFEICLEKDEVFEPETLIGRSLIVQFGPPDAGGHQLVRKCKPFIQPAAPEPKGGES